MAATADRRAGVFLHVTSLPGPDGIGDLGAPSRAFVEWLARAGQGLWQTLPLHPPANDVHSPYDAASAFAGHPLLLSLDDLTDLGLLESASVAAARAEHAQRRTHVAETTMVAGRSGGYDPLAAVSSWKLPLIEQAADALLRGDAHAEPLARALDEFCEREAYWLDDYVAFVALRRAHPNEPRSRWPIADRVKRGVSPSAAGSREAAIQFLFQRQLGALHVHARAHGVWLMGDAPIYVGEDSADVWANPELFLLDDAHVPASRTGAPPDALDPGGQIWPMPAYDWTQSRASGHRWWMQRLRHELANADVLRLDHFRAFADWWCVPPHATNAQHGEWRAGPGMEFFDVLRAELGSDIRLVAEDLGMVTAPLAALVEQTQLPRMRVLVQGLDEDADSIHRPEAWSGNEAAYTHTHDFDTIRGWGEAASGSAAEPSGSRLQRACAYLGAASIDELADAAIRRVLESAARYAIIPLQDWLDLGSSHRMNVPGTAHGNWRWIAPDDALSDALADRMRRYSASAGRATDTRSPAGVGGVR